MKHLNKMKIDYSSAVLCRADKVIYLWCSAALTKYVIHPWCFAALTKLFIRGALSLQR